MKRFNRRRRRAARCYPRGYRWREDPLHADSMQLVSRKDMLCRVRLTDPGHRKHRWEAMLFSPGDYPKLGYYRTLGEAQHHCECLTVRNIFKARE